MEANGIVISPDPRLRQECAPIEEVTPEIEQLVEHMKAEMFENRGCGLAAPQVGELVQLVIVDVDYTSEKDYDPYVLISILSALHEGEWTADEVQGTLENLFDRQYILTERVVRETRYDSDGDPYSWYICYVTLENKNLSHLPLEMMGEEQMARYSLYMSSLYMSTLGNRPDLFPESAYVGKYITNPPADYDVPEEYLDDETFAAILGEAEKYLGYPYVWGGSSPATSFDCSGFVSWVINHSGWNVGRLGAQGLYNICTPTSAPRPGDLVFFVGTYDTAGVSHCGIYVGDGMMIHCGDPIQYANLNTSYWQSHFYAYGRLP